METDSDVAVLSTRTAVGLVVAASLGAVCAFGYTPLGRWVGTRSGGGSGEPGSGAERMRARAVTTTGDVDGILGKAGEGSAVPGTGAGGKGRRKRKSKSQGEDDGTGEGRPHSRGMGAGAGAESARAAAVSSAQVVPGGFEGVGADENPQETSKQPTSPSPKSPKKKNKAKKQKLMAKEREGQDAGSDLDLETGKDTDVEHLGVDPRSGENPDASLSPSVSGDALPGSAVMAEGSHKAWPFKPPGLSSDVDGPWTHVDSSHLKTSTSIEGPARAADEVKDSDVNSTASAEEVLDRILMQLRGPPRVPPVPRRRYKTTANGIDLRALMQLSDDPTPARVLRVQPRADETPVPGFSWEDYGDVVKDRVVNDANEEGEGEWDVVRSRHRTRPQPVTSASTATPHVPAVPEPMTKKQRQNARKRELAKAAKAEGEVARLQGLAKHQRELERLRIMEQSRQGGGKQPSGGMQATVDEHGKLVWE